MRPYFQAIPQIVTNIELIFTQIYHQPLSGLSSLGEFVIVFVPTNCRQYDYIVV
jgi:hypothetical protein